MGGASSPRPARSACLGRPGATGRAATRPTATVRSSGSCRRWSGWRCVEISPRFLSQDERIEIADLRHAGLEHPADRAAAGSGAVDDLARAAPQRRPGDGGYRPFEAHRRATARRARDHRRRVETNAELRQLVAELLAQRWSPQQISRHLRARFPDEPGDVAVSREHLPGRLPAGISTDAPVAVGSAPSLAAAHRARSSARSAAHRTPSATV